MITRLAEEGRKSKAELGLSERELFALARTDFWCFVELMFPVLHPGKRLNYAPYLGLIATVLMQVASGYEDRVIFNLPPRHMKSLLVSILYPAWRLGCDPTAKFICISYGDDLAHEHSVLTRKAMMSPLYERLFPNTRLDKKAQDHIRTTKGGQRYATAVGSDVTGFGADTIIVDDPMEPNDAGSEAAKERVRQWIGNSVLTRFDDQRTGKLLLVMHRLAPDDICSTYEATGDFTVIKLPLVAEEEIECYYDDIPNKCVYRRSKGDILNPSRFGLRDVQRLKASLPPHVFASQYQQRPVPGGSGMLSLEKFRRYHRAEPPSFECIIHSWDVGATTSGNKSVLTSWGLRRDGTMDSVYLLDVVRLQLELPEVLRAIKTRDLQDQPALIIIDERGVGLGVYQQLRRDEYAHVCRSSQTKDMLSREGAPELRPSESKINRFGRAALAISQGQVKIPTEAPWLEQFLYEVAAFPNIPDNDQVDSMTQLVANLERATRLARLH